MKKIFYLLAIALLPSLSQAQKLGELNDALNNDASSGSSFGEGRSNGGGNDNSVLAELIFQLAWEPTFRLFFGFRGETPANDLDYNDFPYADGESGLYLPFEEQGRRMAVQLTAHLQTSDDAVYGGYFQAKFSPNRAISIDLNRLQLIEALEAGGTDHFSVTNFNLLYNRVHHPKFQLWWGGGLMLHDGGGVLYGSPSATVGFTWYIKKPISLYADTQLGWPNAVFARQHQVRVQMHRNRFIIYAGYQGIKAGSISIPNWAMGTGVWF